MLGRAFDVLAVLERSDVPLGLTEIAQASGIPKATVFRLLGQLVQEHAVVRRGELYTLGMRLFALGAAVRIPRRLADAALPVMSELSAAGQVVHLGVLEAGTALQIQRVAYSADDGRSAPSTRRPLHATALGKALLAQVAEADLERLIAPPLAALTRFTCTDPVRLRHEIHAVRTRGVAYERNEWVAGFCAVGAPIGALADGAFAAVSVAGRHGRIDLDRAATAVRSAAARIAPRAAVHPWSPGQPAGH